MCILTIDHVILKLYHYWTAVNDKVISCMVKILTTKESSYHKYIYTLMDSVSQNIQRNTRYLRYLTNVDIQITNDARKNVKLVLNR